MEVKFKKVHPDALTPIKGTTYAAAYDLRCVEDFEMKKGRNLLPTGIAVEMPQFIKANVRARSGFSAKGFEVVKYGEVTRVDADVVLGLVDSDYRGEIKVIVKYHGDDIVTVKRGTRIAQLEFCVVPETTLVESDELSESERSTGGFGSTGTK